MLILIMIVISGKQAFYWDTQKISLKIQKDSKNNLRITKRSMSIFLVFPLNISIKPRAFWQKFCLLLTTMFTAYTDSLQRFDSPKTVVYSLQ